jgi:phytoene dehydrogenase-like protein
MNSTKEDVIIIGAGLSGLSAAIHLQKQGRKVKILEASERAGGRIKTDKINGFRLDRGFQVLLTAYPETKNLLNYEELNLKKMLPGAHILYENGSFELADPFRQASALFSTLFAPVGSLKDKFKTFLLKRRLLNTKTENLFSQTETTSLEKLKSYGFSDTMIERFYAPFFSGIFLENKLQTSSRMFDFVMKMFSEGEAAIPALGMEEIPKQLVQRLEKDTIFYNKKVININGNQIELADGTLFEANQILIASEANEFTKRFNPKQKNEKYQVSNVYFEARNALNSKPIVILNASKNKKWVNNLTVISNVSKELATNDKVLISVSYNGIPTENDEDLAQNMKNELQQWFGNQVFEWKLIHVYRIEYALPNQNTVKNDLELSDIKLSDTLFVCGDHLLNGSINAALKSGRIAAEVMEKNRILEKTALS